ncbi:unnamed protein product [Linum tenue]|uniref:Aminotransferase-like plant mobile domain-containing protein n=1 Tax=Linum tenue TaxID=586396 RepID=A0AAV0R1J4_9ROSI|nr:unnamed protein product [Linum tenue]
MGILLRHLVEASLHIRSWWIRHGCLQEQVPGVRVSSDHSLIPSFGGHISHRLWTLGLIGSTLFVDKSSDRVRGWLYSYFRDLKMVSKYVWGAGALAWMYRQLGRSSRAGSKGFYGCLTGLQAWIYEYFPLHVPHTQ